MNAVYMAVCNFISMIHDLKRSSSEPTEVEPSYKKEKAREGFPYSKLEPSIVVPSEDTSSACVCVVNIILLPCYKIPEIQDGSNQLLVTFPIVSTIQ